MTKGQIWYRQVYLRSEHWRNLRRRKFQESPSCYTCRSREHLDIHHASYQNLYKERLSELITLCRRCHQLTHATDITEAEKIARERELMAEAEKSAKRLRLVRKEKRWLKRKLRKRSWRTEAKIEFGYRCMKALRNGTATDQERKFL